MNYLQGYPQPLQEQARALIDSGAAGPMLQRRYPQSHAIRTDGALYDYVNNLRLEYLRGAPPLAKVAYDNKLRVVAHALGTHTAVSRVQGGRLKAKREIRIAAMFRHAPLAFLRMITVHELAHLKERAHDRAFYQLCCHMEPDYHQLEFDLRLYLSLGDPHEKTPGRSQVFSHPLGGPGAARVGGRHKDATAPPASTDR